MTADRVGAYSEGMVDLRMPEGLTEPERQRWLEDIARGLVEETGEPSGYVHQDVPGEQPVFGFWWTDELAVSGEDTAPPAADGRLRTGR